MNFLDFQRFLYRPRSLIRSILGDKPGWSQQGLWFYRVLLAAVAIGSLTYFSSYHRPYNIGEMRIGSVAPERIKAPFLFQVPKNENALAKERWAAEAAVPTLLLHNPEVKVEQIARLDSVFKILIPGLRLQMPESLKQRHLQRELPHVIGSLSDQALSNLAQVLSRTSTSYIREFEAVCMQILENIYTTGVLSSKQVILDDVSQQVRIGERELPVDAVYSEESLKQGEAISLIEGYRAIVDHQAVEAVHELLSLFITPNLTIAEGETQRLRAEARGGIASIKRIYAQDDVILEKNETVTEEHVEALNALAERIAARELENPVTRISQTVAAVVISTFLIFVFGYYLATREGEVYQQPGSLLLLAILVCAVAATASYIKNNSLDVYLVPTPLSAMLATILLNPQIGLVVSLLLGLFVGNLFGDFYIALICALTSAVAVYSVRQVRHRNQFYRAMTLLPISYGLLIAAADILRFVPVEELYDHILPGIFIGVATPILTIGLLPIFESLFRRTTDITLLELSDLNRPLLRDLAIRAPGTYTHSLIMANLSESAAEAIGANSLLARVGCYYHDIGKMIKPEYFAENQGLQGGRNPHNHLTPNMSMLVITSHVKEGLELAEDHGLPQSISDLIPQHHGTTVVDYFYNRAVELGDENVRQDDFRYNGPKPQTKEAGILMLADSVESAVRTLTERTPNRVRQLVQNITQQKFTLGELDECALTLQDLHKIEESFIPVLMGTLHGRVEYPWQQTKKKERKSLAGSV